MKIENAGVHFPPPFIYLGGLLAGWLLGRFAFPLPLNRLGGAVLPVGATLVVLGVALVAWGMLTFRRAHTAIVPHHPASSIVTSGPYRFTRNPMYTGLAIAYCGAAAVMNSAWPLVLLPLVIALVVRFVIDREEAYLASAFGADYSAYRQRVRRWL